MGPTRAEPRVVAFLGFGLIGGSIAAALRAREREPGRRGRNEIPGVELRAWTPSGHGPAAGRERGLLDASPPSATAAIDGADLVVLAAPPLATLDLLGSLAGPWRAALGDDAVVTDVASTKAAIVDRADALRLRFVGGHPMAGRESSGVDAASADLFVDRPWAIVPGGGVSNEDVALVERLATRVGARPVRLTGLAHDAAVAAISHLPLVLAAALGETVAAGGDWPAARALAATGWRDTTRLARGDPEMGAGILATNADAVAERLVGFRAAIDGWIEALRADGRGVDAVAIRARLAAVRSLLEATPEPDR